MQCTFINDHMNTNVGMYVGTYESEIVYNLHQKNYVGLKCLGSMIDISNQNGALLFHQLK